jgi:hypothetical protein
MVAGGAIALEVKEKRGIFPCDDPGPGPGSGRKRPAFSGIALQDLERVSADCQLSSGDSK